MRVLVTGGAGFIGSNFVRYLLESTEYFVLNLDALTYAGTTANLEGVLDDPRHEFVEGDIRNERLVDELVDEHAIDAIVNFAAESHVDRAIDDAHPFVSTNVGGTRTLLDVARDRDVEQFLQISTDEVYGQILEGKFSENDPLDPRNPYAATKAAADHLVQSYYVTHDVPALVTRAVNNYGPRQHPEKLIPKFVTRAARGESLPLHGDGSPVREWLYVRDHCRAIHHLLEDGEPGEVYNVGSGVELTNLEVTHRILSTVDASTDLIEFVADRPGQDQRYALEDEKMRALGWEPEWSFEEGLRRTIEYYQ
jgi:dTDP-glucose 4,6-dehydratase